MEWYMWLISGGVVAVLGALVWVFWRWVKGTKADAAVDLVGGLVQKAAGFLSDDPAKLDAHDIVLVVGNLMVEISKWAKDPANKTWDDCKDEVLLFIEQQRTVIPQLEKLSKETLEKVGAILFSVAKMTMDSLSK